MNELGHALREAREALGFTLAEAEDRTRIRQKFIAAMETEDWDALPGDVTTRGFLRKYATFLGLNPDDIVEQYQQRSNKVAAQSDVAQAPAERPVDYRPIELALAEAPPRNIPWRGLLLLVLLGVIVGAIWWVYVFRPGWINNLLALPQNLPQPGEIIALEPTATPTAAEAGNRITATPTFTVEPVQEATPAPVNAEATATTTTGDATVSTETSVVPLDLMRLRLNVIARSWIRLVIDGQVVSESVLEQGTEDEWEARESIVLRTGNAAGVKAILNEQDLPSLGGPGEVIERRWDLVDGEIVETTPTPAPTPGPVDTPTVEPTSTPAP